MKEENRILKFNSMRPTYLSLKLENDYFLGLRKIITLSLALIKESEK
jgi:hypothetical protein